MLNYNPEISLQDSPKCIFSKYVKIYKLHCIHLCIIQIFSSCCCMSGGIKMYQTLEKVKARGYFYPPLPVLS